MNELERRKVEVVIKRDDIKGETLSLKKADYYKDTGVLHGFGLYDEADKLVAWSLSNHALSDWAFKLTRIFNIVHNYNLAEGDDGR